MKVGFVERIKSWWPCLLALATILALFAWQYLVMVRLIGRVICVLDDAYIHMAVGKTFAQHGTWGVNSSGFVSASSSLAWPFLIAVDYFIQGPNEFFPLYLNLFLAFAIVVSAFQLLRERSVDPITSAICLVALVLFVPLVPLIYSGMEHLLQIWFLLLFIKELLRHFDSSPSRSTAWLCCLAALNMTSRFEAAFLVGPCALVLFLIGKRKEAILTLASLAFVPLCFGLVSMWLGGEFLPHPIQLKPAPLEFSLSGLTELLGPRAFRVLGSSELFSVVMLVTLLALWRLRPQAPRATPWGNVLYFSPVTMLFGILLAADLCIVFIDKARPLRQMLIKILGSNYGFFEGAAPWDTVNWAIYWRGGVIPIVLLLTCVGQISFRLLQARSDKVPRYDAIHLLALVFLMNVFLHLTFAKTGSFFRYEAYLVALGLLIAGLYRVRDLFPRPIIYLNFPSLAAMGLGVLLLLPLAARSVLAFSQTATVAKNQYEQQFQMARFVHKYYPEGLSLAANDIGAISYFNDLKLLDLWGLASRDVLLLVKQHRLDKAAIRDLALKHQARIAIIYNSWFKGKIPEEWEEIASMKIQDHLNGSDTVSFYSLDPANTKTLKWQLIEFSAELPSTVEFKLGPTSALK